MKENETKYHMFLIFIATIIISTFFILFHECGHILFFMLLGGKFLEAGFKDGFLGGIYVNNSYPNQTARTFGIIGGSLAVIIVAFILCKIIWNTEKGVVFFYGSGQYICLELLYWGISPLIQYGDAYNFSCATGIDGIILSNIFLLLGIDGYFINFHYWIKLMKRTNFLRY